RPGGVRAAVRRHRHPGRPARPARPGDGRAVRRRRADPAARGTGCGVAVSTRDAYLVAAGSAADLIDHPAVTAAWGRPSALTGFTVGGLAEHLGLQVLFVVETLRRPVPTGEVVTLLGHY